MPFFSTTDIFIHTSFCFEFNEYEDIINGKLVSANTLNDESTSLQRDFYR
jgi:hypothetical protein